MELELDDRGEFSFCERREQHQRLDPLGVFQSYVLRHDAAKRFTNYRGAFDGELVERCRDVLSNIGKRVILTVIQW